MRRFLFYIFLLGSFAAIGFFAVQNPEPTDKKRDNGKRKAAAVAVELAPIKIQDMNDEGKFYGSLFPKSEFMVSSKVAGRLKKLHVDVGDMIQAGKLLVEVEDEEFVQAVTQAEADLAIAQANLNESVALLEIGKKEFDRIKTMREQKVSSQAEVESAEAQLKSRQAKREVNKAQVEQKLSQVKTNRIKLSYTRIEGVWNGSGSVRHVGERFQDEGSMLSANTPIISVLDLSSVIAQLEVVERYYFKIRIGQAAEIESAAFPGKVVTGKVVRITPFLDSSTRQGKVEIEIPNSDYLLKPGMFVTARLKFSVHQNVATVPSSSVVRRGDDSGFFMVNMSERIANFVKIEPGISFQNFTEIASPSISEGQVVTLGYHLLEDGSPVILPGDGKVKAEEGSSSKREKKGKRN